MAFAISASTQLFFSAPWDPVVVRRGDALGLRALADQFADAIAPDLSNRVRDGRWVTLLAWCLVRSQQAFHAGGGGAVATRAQQRERYGWLRPVELLCVARTIALTEDWRDRSLAGQRRVRPWYERQAMKSERFGMSMDQFRSYRQTGMYGGYRVAFRAWPGMTVDGDGWRPGPKAHALAQWLDEKLGDARPGWQLHASDVQDALSSRSAKLMRDDPYRWWLRQWPQFAEGGHKSDEKCTLPRRRDDFSVLPEASLLKPLVFGSDLHGERRRKVALHIAASGASDHLAVCEHLGSAFDDSTIARLPLFSRLADAGMALMDLVAKVLGTSRSVSVNKVATHPDAKATCEELVDACRAWERDASSWPRHSEAAHRFAANFKSPDPVDCIRRILVYHEFHGGGLRWFVLRNDQVEPRTPPALERRASRYRFRLWSLCRLATQCGVLGSMPPGVRLDAEAEVEEAPNGDSDE